MKWIIWCSSVENKICWCYLTYRQAADNIAYTSSGWSIGDKVKENWGTKILFWKKVWLKET